MLNGSSSLGASRGSPLCLALLVGLFPVAVSSDFSHGGDADVQKTAQSQSIEIDPAKVACESFLGFGAEWDSNAYRRHGVTDEDFKVIAERVRWMRLPVARIMMLTKWCYQGEGRYDYESPAMKDLYRHLDVCEKLGTTVFLTDWGIERDWLVAHELKDVSDPKYAGAIGTYMRHLLDVKKYTCLKYFIFGNECNHEVKDFDRWKKGFLNLVREFKRLGLDKRVKVVGPDVGMAPHRLEEHLKWFRRGVDELAEHCHAYDIHRYERKAEIRSRRFSDFIKGLRAYALEKDPKAKSKPFIIGEAGMRDGSKPPATNENIAKYEYGVFMADYGIQAANVGTASVLAWMLDDNSHFRFGWGIWDNKPNGLKLRPWFYPWALLCRFVPAGSKIVCAEGTGKDLRVLAALSGDPKAPAKGAWTFCVVNRAKEAKTVRLRVKGGVRQEMSRYVYSQSSARKDEKGFPVPLEVAKHDLGAGAELSCDADSVTVLTGVKP